MAAAGIPCGITNFKIEVTGDVTSEASHAEDSLTACVGVHANLL